MVRERSVATIIAEALDIYQDHPLLFATLALGVMAPYQLIVLAITGAGPLHGAGAHVSAGTSVLLTLINYVFVGPLISALHIHAVVRIGEAERPRLGDVALRGLRVLPVVAAAEIVAGFGIGLGFIVFIVPGFLLTLRWFVVAQVAAVDNEGWLPSLRRSRQLTSGHYRHIFGLVVLVGLIALSVTAGARAIPVGSSSGVASVVLGIAVLTLTASFSALTLALLYFDLRGREHRSL
jgi:hypothetical protein